MHSLLEQYLAEVSMFLYPLTVDRRREELREMRAHLENAIAAYQELGQSEGEAVTNALVQFGSPSSVGMDAVAAWRRGVQGRNYQSFWMTSLAVVGSSLFDCYNDPYHLGDIIFCIGCILSALNSPSWKRGWDRLELIS